MEPVIDDHLDRAEECWVAALSRVRIEDLDSASGCEEWTNRELINHLVGGGLRYAKLLAQAPSAEVEVTRGMDHLGEDLVESFWVHERTFRSLAGECDLEATVPHRIGVILGEQLVRMRILELALHAADLSRGTGMPWPIDDELAEFISTELGDLIVELGSVGGYAPARLGEPALSHAQRVLQISGR
ncbi:maleylpyruvate isomerase N-terminal domain-containing protein [Brevibacterium atlanticum]|uniref:maleylpyruvate isomerase N-terminal domain-containing protein n=1 Tax=Brevibacterium atlanticum TaxID=2697563 RepID=UPI001423B3B1|nr:maleylpyruvate isomerase N-terminal domain-containing protein [Brevibacterium atlanticum]